MSRPGTIVLDAAAAVLESDGLAKTLRHILAVGNAMNEGTSRGAAVGVKLASLVKIIHTRGVDRTTTVLDYVVRALSKRGHGPELRHAAQTLPDLVRAAKRVPVSDVLRAFRNLDHAADKCHRALGNSVDDANALHFDDEECDAMAEHEATRFFDTFQKSVGFSLFKAERRRASMSQTKPNASDDHRKKLEAKAAANRLKRRKHATAGRRVARLERFVDGATRDLHKVKLSQIDEMTHKVDVLCDYFGEDDSTKIFEELHNFLEALIVAIGKADDDARGVTRDQNYDLAGGSQARRRIQERREALFPSNPQ